MKISYRSRPNMSPFNLESICFSKALTARIQIGSACNFCRNTLNLTRCIFTSDNGTYTVDPVLRTCGAPPRDFPGQLGVFYDGPGPHRTRKSGPWELRPGMSEESQERLYAALPLSSGYTFNSWVFHDLPTATDEWGALGLPNFEKGNHPWVKLTHLCSKEFQMFTFI